MIRRSIFQRVFGKRLRQQRSLPRVEHLEARRLFAADGLAVFEAAPVAEGEAADIAPDFSLVDLNPGSPTYNREVSPRDYLGGVSVWMFGYST